MPKSLPNRIESLEKTPRRLGSYSCEENWFIKRLERLIDERRDELSDAVVRAWDAYADVRQAIVDADVEPPSDYRQTWDRRRRDWHWQNWDCPQLDRVLTDLLRALATTAAAPPV